MEPLKLPTILVISDNPSITHWVRKNLESRFYILDASSSQKAVETAQTTRLDFLILDSQIEDGSALELSKKLRQINPAIPILLITGRLKKIFREAAVASGVTDFLNDELSLGELELRLSEGEKTAQARKKTSTISSQIKNSKKKSSPVDLKKRTFLNEKALRLLADVKNKNVPITFLLISIDAFEQLQESNEISSRDKLFAMVGQHIIKSLRPADLLIPSAEGQYILLLPNALKDDAQKTAEMLRRSVQENPFILDTQKLHVTISIAISPLEATEEQYQRMVAYASKVLRQAQTTKNLIISLDREE